MTDQGRRKSLLFFSRSELTFLYGSVHSALINDFDIIHVAYSRYEADILSKEFDIQNIIVFKELTSQYLDHKITPELLESIDLLLVNQTDGRFNLNSALQSNRTSKYIGFPNALKLAGIYFNAWHYIFNSYKIDFFVHEPVSLLMNQLAAALCKAQGGVYTTHIMVQGEDEGNHFIMVDDYNGQPTELQKIYHNIKAEDLVLEKERLDDFVKKFRSSYGVFFNSLGTGKAGLSLAAKLGKRMVKQKVLSLLRPSNYQLLNDNIEIFIEKDNLTQRRFINTWKYKQVKYDSFDPHCKYYFYPLHLEPEAVVLYWADGLYTNQVKLIENIAAQLPPDVLLYVKDHPHLYGYRDIVDYKRIQEIPNVRLINTDISGKQIVKDCLGVITINGTGGFEALLMNKHVITFGSAFYGASKRVKTILNIRDLREELYRLKDVVYQDDDELDRFVLSFLISQKEGFTDFYGGMHKVLNIDLKTNAKIVATGLKAYFETYDYR